MTDRPSDPEGGDEREPVGAEEVLDDEEREEPSVLGAASTLAVEREPGRRRRRREADGGGSGDRFRLAGAGLVALVVVVGALLLAFVPAFASGFKKTPRDKVGISYGGGPFEGAHYQRIVAPGSSLFFNGLFDPLYLYPADQRNYIISKQKNVGATSAPDSVVAPSKDRVQVEYQVAVYFKLNTDRLRDFHEQFGLKYKAYTASGWNALIQDTFRQQIENSLQEETRRYNVADLFGDAKLLVTLQNNVQKTLSQRLIDALGEQYFCAPTFKPGGACDEPTFIVKKVEIPKSVTSAFEDNRTSRIQIQTRLNEIQQRQAEAAGIAALNDALSVAGQNYVLLKAIESGKINFWVLPQDAGLTLTTPNGTGTGSSGSGSDGSTTTPGSTSSSSTTTTSTTSAGG